MAINTDLNEALLKDLLAIYTDAETQMLEKVAKRVKKGITEEGWNEAKLQDTQKLRKEIGALLNDKSKLAKSKVGKGILAAYKEGVNSAEKDAGKPLTAMQDLNVPLTIQNLLLTNYNLLDDVNAKILRNANDAYRDIMAESASGLLSGVDTRVQASQKMMDRLAAKGITSFTDKVGRQWQLSSYAEMAMRTASNHAAIEGHIQTQQSFGMDLMRVSRIGTTCPICARWQGVVLSISGKTPGYHTVDEARAAGLFHPNCKHTITMFDPEIDGEGQKELNSDAAVEKATARYDLLQQQRSNERSIRFWKRREAASIDPKAKEKARRKVKEYQYKNLLHCEKHNLKRDYAREGVRYAKATSPDMLIGGHLKDYTQMYQDVVGEDPRKAYNAAKTFLSEDSEGFEKWVRDEIKSLKDIDIERAQMRDPSNKAITPTYLYKKYIGDSPMQDYATVAPYEKGSKEFKSGYAKWLKQQVEGIGTVYKVKPATPEVIQIPPEDRGLSATNLYKKYYGQAPTEAYKAAGGEEGTGMKYGKWVETQKKNMIANGVTKTPGTTPLPLQPSLPTPKPKFENVAAQKTQKVVEQAEKVIKDAKKVGIHSKGKDSIANIGDVKARKKAALKEADAIFDEILKDPDYAIETLEDFGIDVKDIVDPKGIPGSYSKEKLANTLAKLYDIKEEEFPGTTKWRENVKKVFKGKEIMTKAKPFEKQDYDEIISILAEKYSPSYQLVFADTLTNMRGFAIWKGDENAAYYSPSGKFVNLDVKKRRQDGEAGAVKSRYQTFFHEMGHAIDDRFAISDRPSMRKALSEDRKALSEEKKAEIPKKGAVREHLPDSVRSALFNLDQMSGKLTAGVHDTLGGLGFDRGYGAKRLKWGHEESYWDRGNRLNEATSENFAHVSEALANEHNINGHTYDEAMKKIFPHFVSESNRIIADEAERIF